jgi:ribosomal protein S18 acetylase RimI-like enzyme
LLVRAHHDFDAQRFIAATPDTEEGYARFLATQVGTPNAVILVAAIEGVIVGYAWGGLEGYDYMALRGPAGALYDIVVRPESRGRGVGAALLTAVLAALEANGAPRIVLSTATQNVAAQRLFARVGFRPTMVEMTRESGASAQK